MEPDLCRMAPHGVSVHSTRVRLQLGTVEGLLEMEKRIEAAAKLIASTRPDVIVFGCTLGSFMGGKEWDRKIIEEIKEKTGVQAITVTTAAAVALKELNIRKVSIAHPYQEETNAKIQQFFNASDFQVINIKGLKLGLETGLVSPGEIYTLVKDVCKPEADGLFISCTNFRASEAVENLERDLRKPVVTATQAIMWNVFRKLKIREPKEGFGNLMTTL